MRRLLWLILSASCLAQMPMGGVTYVAASSQVATPTYDNDTGSYVTSVTVTISDSTGGAAITYCTATGSDCDPVGGTSYSTPVTVSVDTTHLCAYATHSGMTDSATKCATYTITASSSPITRTGSCSNQATAPATCTLSAVNTGDLIVCQGYRGASTTAPGTPGSNTSVLTRATTASGTTAAERIWCRKASSGSDTGSGSSTNSTAVACVAYSGTNVGTTANCNTTGIGGTASNAGKTSVIVDYPALTMTSTDGSSYVAGFAADSAAVPGAPTGMTTVSNAGATPGIRVSDTNAGVSAWADQTVSITSGTYVSATVEIVGQRVATPTPSVLPGYWANSQTVSLSDATGSSTIHYTTDNSTPTCASTTYSSGISVPTTTTIKAVGCKSGYATSDILSADYHIGNPGIVQFKACQDWSNYNTTWTCSFDSPTTAGNAIISFFLTHTSYTLTSIGDTHNTYAQDFTLYFMSDQRLYFHSVPNATSAQTLTYTISGSGHYQAIIMEVAGLATTGPLVDKTVSFDNGYNGGLTFTSNATATTSQANEFLIGWAENYYPNLYNFTDGANWYLLAQEPIGGSRIAVRAVTSTGAYSYTGSIAGTGEYEVWAAVVTYKAQ